MSSNRLILQSILASFTKTFGGNYSITANADRTIDGQALAKIIPNFWKKYEEWALEQPKSESIWVDVSITIVTRAKGYVRWDSRNAILSTGWYRLLADSAMIQALAIRNIGKNSKKAGFRLNGIVLWIHSGKKRPSWKHA